VALVFVGWMSFLSPKPTERHQTARKFCTGHLLEETRYQNVYLIRVTK